MPVPQKIFCYCGRQARCLFHKKFFVIVEDRQDACSTKNFLLLWKTGKMPVPQKIFCYCGRQARCLFHKKFFVIVERASCPFNIFWKFYQ
ncbi:hypothetical protein QUB16_25340 [Microcoleus sp. D3_18a_C4]